MRDFRSVKIFNMINICLTCVDPSGLLSHTTCQMKFVTNKIIYTVEYAGKLINAFVMGLRIVGDAKIRSV